VLHLRAPWCTNIDKQSQPYKKQNKEKQKQKYKQKETKENKNEREPNNKQHPKLPPGPRRGVELP
jgi:hypothetical protein